MPRRFIELDGTVDNVGDRIKKDYSNKFGSCHSKVGSYAVERLEYKLGLSKMQSLGFTGTELTKHIGSVDVCDTDKLERIIYELENIYMLLGDTYGEDSVSSLDRYNSIKEHKMSLVDSRIVNLAEYVNTINAEWRDKMEAAGTPITRGTFTWTRSIRTPYLQVFWENISCLYTNTPDKQTLGMRPSRFIRKYIEHLIPGISDRYSAALSNTKKLEVHLTIDPNIMVNCSEAATFSSCYRFEGEYHYSAQRFMNGDDVLMAVVFDSEGRIMYRNWVLVAPDSKSVITFRAYSSLDTRVVGKPIKQLTRSHILGTSEYTYTQDADSWVDIECEGGTYLDSYSLATLHDLENEDDEYMWGRRYAELGSAIDIEAGYATDEDCIHREQCQCCDDYTSGDLNEVAGDAWPVWVCDYCFNEEYVEVENRDLRVHHDDVVENVHGAVFHMEDIGEDHIQVYSGEWYPYDEVTEAYDTSEYHATDDLTYSRVLDRYYYGADILLEDEAEYEEENKDTEEEISA